MLDIRYRQLKTVSAVLLAANLLLAALKLATGYIFGSLAVVSDGLDSAADVATVCLMLLGIYLARDPADADHPYGHQRMESVVSVLLGLAVGASGVYILVGGASGFVAYLNGSQAIEISPLLIAVSAVSAAAKLAMAQVAKRTAILHNSSAMLAGAGNYRADALTSLAVLVGVVGAILGAGWLDPLAAVGVSILILKTAIEILRAALSALVDKSLDESSVAALHVIVLSIEGVLRIDEMRTRISGNVVFVDIDIAVDGRLTVTDAHCIAEAVHDAVECAPFMVSHCMVHVNPDTSRN